MCLLLFCIYFWFRLCVIYYDGLCWIILCKKGLLVFILHSVVDLVSHCVVISIVSNSVLLWNTYGHIHHVKLRGIFFGFLWLHIGYVRIFELPYCVYYYLWFDSVYSLHSRKMKKEFWFHFVFFYLFVIHCDDSFETIVFHLV